MSTTTQTLTVLCGTAATIGAVHTLLGPDHYLPFVAMSRAGRWSLRRTVVVTALCGLGHVLGSVVLGLVGIAVGAAVFTLEAVESFRADVAGWLLLGFGIAYAAWGVRRAVRSKPHTHWHVHDNGTTHTHPHAHVDDHAHAHVDGAAPSLTPWVLFTIFVFGPCEPLIPLLMYPAAQGRLADVLLVAVLFGAATLATMLTVVVVLARSVQCVPFGRFERYTHAFAGLAIVMCGLAIRLGL